jgi:lipopolysaccharide transport system permease protein
MFRDLSAARYLGWRLFVRDIAAQYRQSVLGVVWTILPPLVAGVAFIVLRSTQIVNFGETDLPYPVYVLTGTTLWQIFVESLNAPLKAVTQARPVIVKINFPREALIISAFYKVLFGVIVKAFVLAGVLLYFDVSFRIGMLLAPVAVVILVILGINIGLLLTPLGMLFTDVQSALLVVVQFWFFLTPIVYPPPTTFPYSLLTTLNPVSPLLIGARSLLTQGSLANPVFYAGATLATLLAFLFAWLVYRASLTIIIERIGQ